MKKVSLLDKRNAANITDQKFFKVQRKLTKSTQNEQLEYDRVQTNKIKNLEENKH